MGCLCSKPAADAGPEAQTSPSKEAAQVVKEVARAAVQAVVKANAEGGEAKPPCGLPGGNAFHQHLTGVLIGPIACPDNWVLAHLGS